MSIDEDGLFQFIENTFDVHELVDILELTVDDILEALEDRVSDKLRYFEYRMQTTITEDGDPIDNGE